ncbi:MAG: molybdate ABC transporter substrate-binding protein [Planctomycetales bacterium]|nr:molybdate ABC transporter substrate-binding protein [Planctomycetales bacterium]
MPDTYRKSNPLLPAAVVSGLVLLGLATILARQRSFSGGDPRDAAELIVYCAAGLRAPMQQVAKQYEQEFGVAVRLQLGGSNTLLSQLEVAQMGDLFVAADDGYVKLARDKGLIAEEFAVASMLPVVVVPKDNPANVRSIDDLLRTDVRTALASPDQTAMGKATRDCLQKQGAWNALEARVRQDGIFKPTVNDVASAVALRSVDAGVVWDAVARQFDDLSLVAAPELNAGRAAISLGVLASSRSPVRSLHLARYIAACDRGLLEFEKLGYTPVVGDLWAEHPRLTLYAGSVNRRVLEPIVKQFERRHQAEVQTIFNGCGILTAQMRAMKSANSEEFPDAFMACDQYYMDEVDDLFQEGVAISETPIVIAVQRGNPLGVSKLADLVKPGLRVAIGRPEQCTIGVLSRRLLESEDLYDKVLRDNVVAETATSAMLVPSVATGSADAALVYLTDAQAEADRIDIVAIETPLARAVQPFGIAQSSRHKQLGRLLFNELAASRQLFEAAGFVWRLPEAGR